MGEKKLKNSEDKNVAAEIRVQIENAGDSEYADSEFSVRFTTDDFEWHATCIDDRKMSFDEQKLIKKVLATDTAKKFMEYCLNKWKELLDPPDGSDYAMLPFILENADRLGLKGDNAFFDSVKAIANNIDKIESKLKLETSINEDDGAQADGGEKSTGETSDKERLLKKLVNIIVDAAKNYAVDEVGTLLDEVFMGNFRDAVVTVYGNKAGDKLDDEKKAAAAIGDLKKFDGFEEVAKKQNLDSRKDSETSVDVKEDDAKFTAMWYSVGDENIGRILSDLVKTV